MGFVLNLHINITLFVTAFNTLNIMAKSHDARKNVKKEPLLTPKEKKAAKLAKKAKRD